LESKSFPGFLSFVPHKFSICFDQLDLLAIQFTNDPGIEVVAKQAELFLNIHFADIHKIFFLERCLQ